MNRLDIFSNFFGRKTKMNKRTTLMAVQNVLKNYHEGNGMHFAVTNVNRWSNEKVDEKLSELKKLVAQYD